MAVFVFEILPSRNDLRGRIKVTRKTAHARLRHSTANLLQRKVEWHVKSRDAALEESIVSYKDFRIVNKVRKLIIRNLGVHEVPESLGDPHSGIIFVALHG